MITLLIISHLVFHRSLMATLVAIYLRIKHKPLMSSEKKAREFIESKKITPLGKVVVKGLKSKVKEEQFNGEQLFIIGEETKKVILYLHGGAFAKNITKSHLRMIDKICLKSGLQIYLPLYKKIPHYSHKEIMKDLIDLYLKLVKEDKEIILMGDSAGGTLVFSLSLYLKNNNIKMPSKLIGLSPLVDLSMDRDNYINEKKDSMEGSQGVKVFIEYYANGEDLKSPSISPMYGDLKNLPKTLIVAGGRELLIEDILLFVSKLKENNVDVTLINNEHMGHVYPAYPIWEAKSALNQIVEFIKKEN